MTQQQKILNRLKFRTWVPFEELNQICFRYSARIYDIRKKGIEIDNKLKDGKWWYRLETDPIRIDFDKCELKVNPVPKNLPLFGGTQ